MRTLHNQPRSNEMTQEFHYILKIHVYVAAIIFHEKQLSRNTADQNERMILVVAYGERNGSGEMAQGEIERGTGRQIGNCFEQILAHNTSRGNRDVWARVRAGATHRDPRCAQRTYAEILLRHYRGQLHGLDMRNIVIYRVLPRKTKTVTRNTWDCLDGVGPRISPI